jgi:putative Mg2+ transporter-C (MgtC) family protein
MPDVWRELAAEIPDATEAIRFSSRLLLAALLGGVLGYERQRSGKSAGLRTHMLVALGSACFVVGTAAVGGSTDDLARIVQGVAAGIGFIGAGAILKGSEGVRGITTAASIWMTAALGVAAGMGRLWLAAFAAFVAWGVLAVLSRLEPHPRAGDSP